MKARLLLVTATLTLLANGAVRADGGFATRDLNPLLQPIYLPTLATFNPNDGWKIDHSLYITNTEQDETSGDERLQIDVENYRYELGLRLRQDNGLMRLELPYVDNSEGALDSTIDSWHDFWGLPEGDRDKFENDDINLRYRNNGESLHDQDGPSSGVGDISLALGYQATDSLAWFAGIELPTGDPDDLTGNDEIDTALWLTSQSLPDDEIGIFGLFGVSFPGDGDYLGGRVEDQIWVAQAGLDYRFTPTVIGTFQFDMHSSTVKNSDLDAFGNSMQIQLGLGFLRLIGEHRVDFFFSEDIMVGTAPDITFGLRLSRSY